ncbi:MAG: hypothetical protein AB7E79_16770 [Rhodospirillaceae bacterium]
MKRLPEKKLKSRIEARSRLEIIDPSFRFPERNEGGAPRGEGVREIRRIREHFQAVGERFPMPTEASQGARADRERP